MAKARPGTPGSVREYVWLLDLHLPRLRWEIVEKDFIKPLLISVESDVEMVTLSLEMGYSRSTQLPEGGQNRILDMNGRRLGRDEALERLENETPVLVCVSGEVPDPFYLQCAKPDTLIVVFGLPKEEHDRLLPAPVQRAAGGNR